MTDTSLPTWSLADLYTGRTDPQIEADLQEATLMANGFAAAYSTQRADTLAGEDLLHAIKRYENLSERLHKLQAYAYLLKDTELDQPETQNFYQRISRQTAQIASPCVFFTLDLAKMDDDVLADKFATCPALEAYRPWLRDLRASKAHDLSEELERYLLESYTATREPLLNLFAKLDDEERYQVGGKALTKAELMPLLSNANRAVREEASRAFMAGLKPMLPIKTFIYNTVMAQEAVENTWRQHKTLWGARNVDNLVEDAVVDTLFDTVKESYAALSVRYFKMKAKWLGLPQLEVWDRAAPLPDVPEPTYTWDEAKKIVLDTLTAFSPEMGRIGGLFFEKGWIDAAPRAGKTFGAYSHQTVSGVHPYILMNFTGRLEDVETLAHELGHGIHQYLYRTHGELMGNVPLTVAETASVFSEMLVFQKLLDGMTDPLVRRSHIASKVESMIGTVIRQIAFYDFERRAHTAHHDNGDLTEAELGAIWRETQAATYGDALHLVPDFDAMWSYVSHFFEVPFYVYAYAFGDCLVNSLYAVYEAEPKGFADKYLELLKAGGTLHHYELVAPFGLDTRTPAFWQHGLRLIAHYIDELETLDAHIRKE